MYDDCEGIERISRIDACKQPLPNKPVILEGDVKDWPAYTLWTPTYLKNVAERVQIPVWVYEDSPAQVTPLPHIQKSVMFGDYIDWLITADEEEDGAYGPEQDNADNDESEIFDLRTNKEIEGTIYRYAPSNYYVANVNLNLFPSGLMSQIRIPTYFPEPPLSTNFWMGSAGTSSGLHFDKFPGILAQVNGRKQVMLFSPDQGRFLYRFPTPTGPNSEVDVLRPDFERFPEFRKAKPIQDVLEPGNMLYIPEGWWHNLVSIDAYTISVNFWWRGALPDGRLE